MSLRHESTMTLNEQFNKRSPPILLFSVYSMQRLIGDNLMELFATGIDLKKFERFEFHLTNAPLSMRAKTLVLCIHLDQFCPFQL